ncbi:hypothetical protein SEVIR_1G076700v4 [Setaria viridis]|uniref:Uncharacterized protein n=2 Tax=Setaria TaxID=4554 RepID=A0A368PIQ5_SETIT|nr:uncharacterized protein LOC111257386 [Setaria italica]XP_034573408.1 uncharacterized protein LOC117837754 [Setaria viridis]RCV05364.1 hypothetical protein SETIT_1G078100v2 [Setaria italica]TKW37861.1 hypothetical protein SEVIR_1G076700v2 [Setaria viridis]
MASSELRRYCDTELSLGRRPAPPACAKEEKAPAATACGGGLASTELQAMAILRMARRAAAEALEEGPAWRAAGDGADVRRLSVRRSLELFLRRREPRCQQLGAAASPSSSSCLTDSPI